MKNLFVFLFLILHADVFSQALELRAGHSLTPADYLALQYEYYTNHSLNFSGKIFLENSRTDNLNYNAYGLDLMAEYYLPIGYNTDHQWELKACLGAGIQIENEPWVYKGWTTGKRTNYGILGELAAEWAMTEEYSLTAYLQQKYFFKQALGTTRFVFGLGFKFNLNNY